MINVAVISQDYEDIYPLKLYNNLFKKQGICFVFDAEIGQNKKLQQADIIWLSKRGYGKKFDLSTVKKLSELGNNLYWFDNSDSTGTTNFEVMPYVDKYLKKQLLKDRKLYKEKWYRKRIFSDYYHKKCGIKEEEDIYTKVILEDQYLDKLCLAWNLAFADYRPFNNSIKTFTRNRRPLLFLQPPIKNLPFSSKNNDLFCRMSTNYALKTVSYQRKKCIEHLTELEKLGFQMTFRGKVPPKKYQYELKQAKTVLSPFGWGEVCYRDFEAFLYGACLLKFDVDYIETWPNLYIPHQTYIPLSWDLENLTQSLEVILRDQEKLSQIASNGQTLMQKFTYPQGGKEFVDHVKKILMN